MTFFDKKENVIDIELTPYGKHLLSLGKMKPVYYAFFDDDILYNVEQVQSASLAEENTEAYQRIVSTTPTLRPMKSFIGIETQINRQDFYLSEKEISYPSVNERVHYLLSPIGTNDETSIQSPAWEISFIQGDINSATKIISSDTYGYEQIPQIETDITYTMTVRNENDHSENERGRQSSPYVPSTTVYADGSYIHLEEQQVLLNILEKNGFSFKDGMGVEVFLVDEIDSNILKPLKFVKRKQSVVDGKLIDDVTQADPDIDENYVEYYFDLRVDKEISDDDICEGLTELKSKDIYLDLEVECAEREGLDINIYGTRVTDIEDCD
tara:strand:- start:8468 stop:9442 length:975 start_codon:yes stop_codon:yes gene_type:complete